MLFVEAARLMLHLCVFNSNDMSFAIEMADLINYSVVAVSKSVVILFPVQTVGSRGNWPQHMNIDQPISQWQLADLTWPGTWWKQKRPWRQYTMCVPGNGGAAWLPWPKLALEAYLPICWGREAVGSVVKRTGSYWWPQGSMWKMYWGVYGVKTQTQSKNWLCVGLQQKWL